MKRSTIATAVAGTTVALIAGYRRGKQLIEDSPKLTLTLGYTIPDGTKAITLDTSIGDVKLTPAFGYESGKAIWVTMPEGYAFSTKQDEEYTPVDKIAQAFFEATSGHFRMEPCGTNYTAVISAGWSNELYETRRRGNDNGYTGYWKHNDLHPAPHLNEIAAILADIIDPTPHGPIRSAALTTLDRLRDRIAA